MKKVGVQISAKKMLFSVLTRLETRGNFSHADCVLPDGSLVGAHIFGGVKKTKHNESDYKNFKRYEFEVSDDVAKWIDLQIGRKYDLFSLFRFLLKLPPSNNTSSICSELAFDLLKQADLVSSNFHSQKISPRDLELVLDNLAHNGLVKLIMQKG